MDFTSQLAISQALDFGMLLGTGFHRQHVPYVFVVVRGFLITGLVRRYRFDSVRQMSRPETLGGEMLFRHRTKRLVLAAEHTEFWTRALSHLSVQSRLDTECMSWFTGNRDFGRLVLAS